MSYNKSDGSRQYNKEERGGWYCTNPKKHEESHQHHAADEPHEHRAERNDAEPERQPHHRTVKPPISFEEYMKPSETPAKKQKNGCQVVLMILLYAIVLPFILFILAAVILDDDTESSDADVEYYEFDDNDSDSDGSGIISLWDDVSALNSQHYS